MTTSAQDEIITQLESRYDELHCEPLYVEGQVDGEADYRVTAREFGSLGGPEIQRVLVISPVGVIVHDTDDKVVVP